MPAETPLPEKAGADRSRLTGIVIGQVAAALPEHRRDEADSLARSLIATVHGHCDYALSGAFAMMGEREPVALAKSRVRDAVEQYRAMEKSDSTGSSQRTERRRGEAQPDKPVRKAGPLNSIKQLGGFVPAAPPDGSAG